MKNFNYDMLRFMLGKMKDGLEDVKAEWDGDHDGALEDRARAAMEAQEKIDELESLLEEVYPGHYEKSH